MADPALLVTRTQRIVACTGNRAAIPADGPLTGRREFHQESIAPAV
jgi:hypothetical protein